MKHINGLRRHSDVFGTWYFYTTARGFQFFIYKERDGYWMANKITATSTCTGEPFLRYKGKLYDLLANLDDVSTEHIMSIRDMYPTKMFF